MDGKYIKKSVKRIVIPMITLIVAATQLAGCSSSNSKQASETIGEIEGVEFIVEETSFTEQGEPQSLTWIQLSKLNTYPEFRKEFEVDMGITVEGNIKSGCVYVDENGDYTPNPTLLTAFSNKATSTTFNDPETQDYLRNAIQSTYADLEDTDEYAAIINAYFNILPDSTPNYFNGGKSLSRLEAMTVVTRSTTPVDGLITNDDTRAFTESIGDTEFTKFAAQVDSASFLSASDETLTKDNATKAMSRGEYVYLVMNTIYGEDAITSVDLQSSKLTDIKDTTPTELTKTNAEQLALGLQTPTQAPELIYKALVLANQNNLINPETNWNIAITKTEAIEFITDAIQAYNEANGYKVDKVGTEEEAKESYKEEAKKAYKENKDTLDCTEDEYVDTVLNSINDGLTIEEAILEANETYAKEQPIVDEDEVAEVAAEIDAAGKNGDETESESQSAQQNVDTGNTSSGNTGSTDNSGGNTSSGSGSSGQTYVEPPQQQVYQEPETVYTPPVETPTEAPYVAPVEPATQAPVVDETPSSNADPYAGTFTDEDIQWFIDNGFVPQ